MEAAVAMDSTVAAEQLGLAGKPNSLISESWLSTTPTLNRFAR